MDALRVGDPAPEFSLPLDARGTTVELSSLRGSVVVLLAYVFDFSPGWTNELSEFGNRIDNFRTLGAKLYGISVDSPYSHEAWRNHLGLPDEIALLSDFNRDFGRTYGLLRTLPSGLRDVLRRTVFVLDAEGRIAYRWDNPEPPRLPNVDEVLAEVRKLAAPG